MSEQPRRRRRPQTNLPIEKESIELVSETDTILPETPIFETSVSKAHAVKSRKNTLHTVALHRHKYRGIKLLIVLSIVVIVGCGIYSMLHSASFNYRCAQNALYRGDYQTAANGFEKLGSYEDSATLTVYCKAIVLTENGQYQEGIDALTTLGNYKDCQMRIVYYQAKHLEAIANETDFETMQDALAVYETIPLFLDSAECANNLVMRISEIKKALYDGAVELAENGGYQEANEIFARLMDYLDAEKRIEYYRIRRTEDGIDEEDPASLMSVREEYLIMLDYLDCSLRAEMLKKHADELVKAKYAQIDALIEMKSYSEAITTLDEFYSYGREDVPRYYYLIAEARLQNGDYDGAASAFQKAEEYNDAKIRVQETYYTVGQRFERQGDKLQAILYYRKSGLLEGLKQASKLMENGIVSTGSYHTLGLTSSGTVLSAGIKRGNVENWSNIIAVGAGSYHNVGLKANGTVIATGSNSYGQCNVSNWTDIIAVAVGSEHTIGLKSNGTVVAVGCNKNGECDVNDWVNIVAVEAGSSHTVGLKANGTVVATGSNSYGQCNVSNWTDIIALAAGNGYTVGLKANGTVVAVGYNRDGNCNVSDWTDIVAIAAGELTVGLKADGTIVIRGLEIIYRGISNWTDIIAIASGSNHIVGLKSDGTVVSSGSNQYRQCDVNGWDLL